MVDMTEAAKDGKQERCVAFNSCVASSEGITETPLARGRVMLVAIGRRPYINGLNLENIGVEADLRRRIVIDDQFIITPAFQTSSASATSLSDRYLRTRKRK